MIPSTAVGALHRLAWCTDETEAAELVQEAIRRGADPDDALDALDLWRRIRAEDVHQIRGDGAA